MPTQKDIARAAGVAQPLVSMALKNHPHVADETRARIWAIAQEMGYRPNAALSEAASSRWRQKKGTRRETVAFIRTNPTRPHGVEPMENSLRARLDFLGYGLQVIDALDYDDERSLSKSLYHSGIRGVLLEQQAEGDRQRTLEWRHFAVVQCGLLRDNQHIHQVMLDFQGLVNEAVRRVIAEGFQRIAFLLAEPDYYYSDALLLQAALGLQQLRYFPEAEIEVITVNYHNRPLVEALGSLAKAKPQVVLQGPTAIHRDLDYYRALENPPIPVTLIGDWESRELPGFEPQLELLGVRSADLIDSLLRNHTYGLPESPNRVTFIPRWKPIRGDR